MTLQRALLVSIALHALLLAIWKSPQGLPKETKKLPLVARLVQPAAAPETFEAATPRPLAKPARLPRKTLPIVPQEERAESEARPEAQPVTAQTSAETQSQFPAEVETPGFDPGAIAKYRLEIISAAKRYRRYPPIARENGWQGRVEVRVSFDGAREPAVVLNKSSGYAVLDRQAVETLTKALAPLPPALAGRAFELDFPVVFSFEE
jgi:protein TonB